MQAAQHIESAAAFEQLFLRATGLDPARLRPEAAYRASWIDTPLGPLIALSSETGLHILEFPERRAVTLGSSEIADQAAYALGLYFGG